MYDNLSENSTRQWFHPNEDLKYIQALCGIWHLFCQICPTLSDCGLSPSSEKLDLYNFEEDDKHMMIFLCDLYSAIEQGCHHDKAPHILEGTHSIALKISYEWTKHFVKNELNWSHKASTIAADKLSKYFEEQCKIMTQWYFHLVKIYNILKKLVVNTDQTNIHFVSTWWSNKYETKGAKHIKLHWIEYKHQVTINVSSAANGHCLHFQNIFQGTTTIFSPKVEGGRNECELSK